jgi:hypothetical protein
MIATASTSAFGAERTFHYARPMSAFRGKANMVKTPSPIRFGSAPDIAAAGRHLLDH